jgi:hypothetical protein
LKGWPVFFGLGIIGLVGSFIVAIPGIGYLAGIGPEDYDDEEKYDAGLNILGICVPIVLIPSLIFFLIGWQGYRKNKRLRNVADLLRVYRGIQISELAERLGRSRHEAEAVILECINEDLIKGHIDPKSRRFIVTEPLHSIPPVQPMQPLSPTQPVPPIAPEPVMAYPNLPPPPDQCPGIQPSQIRKRIQRSPVLEKNPPNKLKPAKKI